MRDIINVCWPEWETVKVIGRGSFGTVYEIQRRFEDWVEKAALKIISIPQHNSDIEELYSDGYDEESISNTFKSHLQSILEEYSLMKKMSGCANIVHCDDVRYIPHDNGIGWDVLIKMELLTPLTKTLSDNIAEETVIKLAKDMCMALEECKKNNIIHRDIKPQNIFVSENGDYKLGDFGIAKTVEKTMGGTKIGTYKYMAPEVYNNQPYGSAADIYSLGLVLYWMLNERRMPFMPLDSHKMTVGMDEEARQRRISGEIIPPPAHGREELKKIVLKACSYNPTDRYKDPSEMRIALENLSDREAGVDCSNDNSKDYDIYEYVWLFGPEMVNGCTKYVTIKEGCTTISYSPEEDGAIRVEIPAGAQDGQLLCCMQGCGKLNPMTGLRGDLYLVAEDFFANGIDIFAEKQDTSEEITKDEIEASISLYSSHCKRDSETIKKIRSHFEIATDEIIYFFVDCLTPWKFKAGIAIGKQGMYVKYGWKVKTILWREAKEYCMGVDRSINVIALKRTDEKVIALRFHESRDMENIRLLLREKGVKKDLII